MRKPAFRIYENKGANLLCGYHAADQCHCLHFIVKTILYVQNLKLKPYSVSVQPCLCRTWSETLKTCFIMTQLKWQTLQILIDLGLNCLLHTMCSKTKVNDFVASGCRASSYFTAEEIRCVFDVI